MKYDKFKSKNIDEKLNILYLQNKITQNKNDINMAYIFISCMVIINQLNPTDSILVTIIDVLIYIILFLAILKVRRKINKLEDLINKEEK